MVGASLALTEGLIMSAVTFSSRHVWPLAFTGEPEVVDLVARMLPYMAVLTIMDSCQGVLSGTLLSFKPVIKSRLAIVYSWIPMTERFSSHGWIPITGAHE